MIGKLLNNQLTVPEQVSSLTLSAAQVLSIQTTPVIIVNGSPGYLIIPIWAWFEKPAGVAYVINGQTAFGLYLNTQIVMYVGAGAGFFDQTTAQFRFTRGPGTVGTQIIGSALNDSNISPGRALTIGAATANMTTGDSPIKVSCIYKLVPQSFPWS